MKILFAIAAVFIGTAYASDCKEGSEWAEGKIKMVCTSQGTKPVACLPTGVVGENELQPGQGYSSPSFRFNCTSTGPLSLSYDVIGCLLPGGGPIEIGQEDGIPNKGVYRCVKNADGTISRKFQAGCWFVSKPVSKLYTNGQAWTIEDAAKNIKYQITCTGDKGVFEAQASGCYADNDELIQVGSYFQQGNKFMKCAADANNKQQANFFQVGENEYYEWLQGTIGGEEESAIGDSGSGLTRPPRPTTTPEPVIQTTAAQVIVPATTERVTAPPPEQTFFFTTPQAEQCQDLHPICSTLCSSPCSSSATSRPNNFGTTGRPVRPQPIQQQGHDSKPIGISLPDIKPVQHHAHDEEAIGFAFERSLSGFLFGKRPSTQRPQSPNRLNLVQISGDRPQQALSTRRPSGWNNNNNNQWSNGWGWGHHGGSSWGNSGSWGGGNSWSQGGWNGGQWNGFQAGNQGVSTGKPGGLAVIIGGGKPHGHHFGGSSSSSSESGGHSGHHGHGHGHGHWGNGGGNNGGGVRPPTNGPQPPRECSNLASSVKELIDAMCPKSCGACGKRIDLQAAAAKYSSSKCVAREPSIGLSLDEIALSTVLPAATRPSAGRPSKPSNSWKPSKSKGSKSKRKNKSRGKGKKSVG